MNPLFSRDGDKAILKFLDKSLCAVGLEGKLRKPLSELVAFQNQIDRIKECVVKTESSGEVLKIFYFNPEIEVQVARFKGDSSAMFASGTDLKAVSSSIDELIHVYGFNSCPPTMNFIYKIMKEAIELLNKDYSIAKKACSKIPDLDLTVAFSVLRYANFLEKYMQKSPEEGIRLSVNRLGHK